MNLTEEQLAQALTRLADRADGWPTVDRVAGVRRRARRTATIRAGVAAGTLAAVLALVTIVRVGGLPGLERRAAPPAGTVPAVPATPSLRIDLGENREAERTLPLRQPGSRVVLTVHVHGWVPARSGVDPTPSGREHLLGLTIDWSDGTEGTAGYDTTGCRATAPLVRVDDQYEIEHYVAAGGRHTITYRTKACAPLGMVEQSLVVTAS